MFEKLIDKRLIDRNLRKGIINLDEYHAALNELVDCSDNIQRETPEACEEERSHESAEGATVAEMQSSGASDAPQIGS
jgi:hypothetical protein